MRVAFLGGTRFIGYQAALTAERRGHDVTVLHRGLHNAQFPQKIKKVIVDRSDEESLKAALSQLGSFDVSIDTFSMTEGDAQR